jgi:hypothetical protein
MLTVINMGQCRSISIIIFPYTLAASSVSSFHSVPVHTRRILPWSYSRTFFRSTASCVAIGTSPESTQRCLKVS